MSILNESRARTLFFGAVCFAAVALVGAGWTNWSAEAREKPKHDALSEKMRLKLSASSKVLEGLTTEDADLIREGATAMAEQSQAEFWQIFTDPDYREFTVEFRGSMRRLKEAAAKENFDAAALEWMDATKGCLDCHKHVRRMRAKLNQ